MTANSYSLPVSQNLSLLAISVITPGIFRLVKMHNIFGIGLVVRREALNIMLSVEAAPNSPIIVHFYSYTRDKI
jgi:hypothetical protein